MSNKYDFAAWLETKDPATEYHFSDSCGHCLMGQFMASKGEAWDFDLYNYKVQEVLSGCHSVLSEQPQTFGDARQRLRQLLDA